MASFKQCFLALTLTRILQEYSYHQPVVDETTTKLKTYLKYALWF